MPQFDWQGIDLSGAIHSGRMRARSRVLLERQLLDQGIGLMRAMPRRRWRLFAASFTLEQRAQWYHQLSSLLSAGVRLPQALSLLTAQYSATAYADIISDVTDAVHDGISLDEALAYYPTVFSALEIQLVRAGLHAGALTRALQLVAHFLEAQCSFAKKMRMAAMVPVITFLFFAAVATVILTMILPAFADMITSGGREVPAITQHVINLSTFLQRWGMFGIGVVLVLSLCILYWVKRTEQGRLMRNRLSLVLPAIGFIVRMRAMSAVFHGLGLLVSGGVHLVDALGVVTQVTGNQIIRAQLCEVTRCVAAGQSLSAAMEQHARALITPDTIAMLAVAQDSGALGVVFEHVGKLYENRLERTLNGILTIVQPILMIALGVLIAGLILAVYVPLFTLPGHIEMGGI